MFNIMRRFVFKGLLVIILINVESFSNSVNLIPFLQKYISNKPSISEPLGFHSILNHKSRRTSYVSEKQVYSVNKTTGKSTGHFRKLHNNSVALFTGVRAIADDGTDDTETLRLTIANGTNKLIPFKPGGTYVISSTLELPVGCKIGGNNATIINNIKSPKPLFHITHSNCSISNLTIINKIADSNPNGDKLGSQQSSDIYVGEAHKSTWITHIKISNIKISGGIKHTTAIVAGYGMVENILVENCSVSGSFLTDYHVEWNNPANTGIRSPHNIRFVNCSAINNAHPSGQAFYVSGAYAVSLINCSAKDVRGGIYLSNGDNGIEPGKKTSYIIKDCVIIRHADYGMMINGTDLANSKAWYIGADIDNCQLEGNVTGLTATTCGIRIFKNGGGIKIRNCLIKKSNTGITANDGTGITIAYNKFDNIYHSAINFTHVSNSMVDNNQFKNVNTVGQNTVFDCTILLSYSSNQNTISNNIFGYTGQKSKPYFHIHAINVPSAADLSVNNKIIGNTFYTTLSKAMICNGDISAGSRQKMYLSGNQILSFETDTKLATGAPVQEQ